MLPQLKQNIITLAKQKGLPISKIEKVAGLHKNYLSNLLYGRPKNPGLESILKVSEALGVSIDKLLGKESEQKTYELDIARKDIFFDVVNYLSTTFQIYKNNTLKLEDFIDALYEIYKFSLKKNGFDKEFADWFLSQRTVTQINVNM